MGVQPVACATARSICSGMAWRSRGLAQPWRMTCTRCSSRKTVKLRPATVVVWGVLPKKAGEGEAVQAARRRGRIRAVRGIGDLYYWLLTVEDGAAGAQGKVGLGGAGGWR